MEHIIKNIAIIKEIYKYLLSDKNKVDMKMKIFNEWLFMNLISNGDVFMTNSFNDIRLIDECVEHYINVKQFKLDDIKKIISDNKNITVSDMDVKEITSVDVSLYKHLLNDDEDTLNDDILFHILFQKQVGYVLDRIEYPKMGFNVYKILYDRYKDDIVECVSTPLTSTLVRLGGSYCSISESTMFNSLGNFFNTDLSNKYLIIDVPYVIDFINRVIKRLIEIKDVIKGYIMFIPSVSGSDIEFEIDDVDVKKSILRARKYTLDKGNDKIYPNYEMMVFHKNIDVSDIV